jgi:demethylmenaquinone methyltransferase/2-methoxy-6-polyprenyl-1,4-benzoquinol methylase
VAAAGVTVPFRDRSDQNDGHEHEQDEYRAVDPRVNRVRVTPTVSQGEPEDRLRVLDLDEHLRDPHRKQRFVTTMFEVVAARYDRFTHLFSYGMDRHWKREMLAQLSAAVAAPAVVLDLACGTGDLAHGAKTALPGARVVGFDVARQMLSLARHRAGTDGTGVCFVAGDMTNLPLRNHAAHVVLAGYAIRNAPEATAALREIARVLRRGGLLVTLDFYRPRNALWRMLFVGYLRLAGNVTGWLWHRQPVAYGYIAASIERHVSWQEMSDLLNAQGFRVRYVSRKLLGGIAIHAASLDDGQDPGRAG